MFFFFNQLSEQFECTINSVLNNVSSIAYFLKSIAAWSVYLKYIRHGVFIFVCYSQSLSRHRVFIFAHAHKCNYYFCLTPRFLNFTSAPSWRKTRKSDPAPGTKPGKTHDSLKREKTGYSFVVSTYAGYQGPGQQIELKCTGCQAVLACTDTGRTWDSSVR